MSRPAQGMLQGRRFGRLAAEAVKIWADGGMSSRTAAIHGSYPVRPYGSGILNFERDELTAPVITADPLLGIRDAILRRTGDGLVLGPAERLPAREVGEHLRRLAHGHTTAGDGVIELRLPVVPNG